MSPELKVSVALAVVPATTAPGAFRAVAVLLAKMAPMGAQVLAAFPADPVQWVFPGDLEFPERMVNRGSRACLVLPDVLLPPLPLCRHQL